MPKSDPPRKRTKPMQKKKQPKNELMGDLRKIDRESREMLKTTAQFSPHLMNEQLIDAGDREQIHNNASILSRDTIQMKNDLEALWQSIPKRYNPEDLDDRAHALDLGNKYMDWQERYERVIVPTIQRLSELLEEASKNLNGDVEDAEIIEEPKGDSNDG